MEYVQYLLQPNQAISKIYIIGSMPQLNDKQTNIARDRNQRTFAKLRQLQQSAALEEKYSLIPNVCDAIDAIAPEHLEHPDTVIDDILYATAEAVATLHKEEGRNKLLQPLIASTIKKIVDIFGVRTKRAESLSFINKLLQKKSVLFYRTLTRSSSVMTFYSSSHSEPNKFYHECVSLTLAELLKYHRLVWEIQLKDLIDFAFFLNNLQTAPLCSKEGNDLVEALAVQLLAYFKSGRPELLRYCQAISSLKQLEEQLLKKVDRHELIRYITELGPSLAEVFLRASEWEMRRAGLALMENYIEGYYDRFRKKREEEWKEWVEQHQVFEVVFSDFKFCEQIIDKHAAFFRCLRRYKNPEERTVLLVGLLKQDMEGCNKFNNFICKQLDCYYLDQKSKEVLLEHLSTVTNYAAVPSFFETLQDIPIRDSEGLLEKVYLLLLRIMKQDYEKMGESQRIKCFAAFKHVFQNKYISFFRNKSLDQKQKILKETMIDLLSDITTTKIAIFNFIFIEHELWKTLSNTTFQNLITEVVAKCQFFDKIFSFLESRAVGKSNERDFVKIVKFITNKVVAKQDAIFKYIHIISSFPDIFEELIENSGYAQIEELMKKVIQLFKDNPLTPFHILTLTFERINHQCYSDVKKLPSLLQQNKEQKQLSRQPKEMKLFEAINELMLETAHQPLRSQIAAFLLSLYTNYAHANIYSTCESGQETFITFITELADTFSADYKEFLNNPSLSKVIMVDLQLLEKALQFTDTLGCGEYRPHKSLVSTSTILLSVANNVTFGDDVPSTLQKDFPSSATLFEALTHIGLAFKCGPENMVLKQGPRFIPPIFNSTSLEDLQLTQQQIIAEQNSANALQTPDLFEAKTSDFRVSSKLLPVIVKLIGDVFNRFAFEGKMSLLECTSFVRRASGSECLSSDRRVQEVFDFDADRDGIVTLNDFIEYYRKNLAGPSYWREQTLKGLYNLRYRKNLTLYNQPLDISNEYYLMMRFKIAKHYHQIYEHLFAIANHPHPPLSSKAKYLLLLLPSWPKLHSQIAGRLDFKHNSQFEIYYKLIAIWHQLSACTRQERQARVQQFVANKNNQLIFMLLTEYHNKHNKSEYEQKSLLICLRILRSLVNVEDLSSNSRFESAPVPALPQTTYFAQNTLIAYKSRNMINFETLLVLQLSQKQADLNSGIEWCFDGEQQLRRIACNFLYLWSCKNSHFADLFRVPIPEHNNQQWFELLCAVINQGHAVDLDTLRNTALSVLQEREESFQNQYDPLMNGYLKILSAIASRQSFLSPKVEAVLQRLLTRSFSEKNRTLVFGLISGERREMGYSYFQRMLSTILPSQQCLIRQRFVGIKNLGAICYINSILQQFFMIDHFRHMVLSKPVPKEVQRVEVGGREVVDDFMYQLQKLYHHLHHSKKKYLVPTDFCFSFKNFEGQPINTSVQEDAHQFLNRLIESAEAAFKKEERVEEFEQLLSIRKLTEIECEVCKHRIDKLQNDYCLTLQVKNHDTLAQSLRKFTEREEITGYFCEQCKRQVNRIFKRTFLNQLPQVLILNLQRIIYDQTKGEKAKVHSQLTFPHNIDFSDYIKNDLPADSQYRLKGVVIHTGTSEGGHYYSLIRTKKFGWLKFNDQSVTGFEEKDIERECFGGFEARDGWGEVNYSTNAYILFYQRAQLKEKEYIQAQNEFSSEVQTQNGKLINELQVHQESFFNAIISNYQKARPHNLDHLIATTSFLQNPPSASQQQQFRWLIRIVHKAFSFLGVYTEIKSEIRSKISAILKELYFILPQETMNYFNDCNVSTYFQNMISASSSNQRQTLKDTFLYLLLIHINYYHIDLANQTQNNAYLLHILDKALSYCQSKLFYANIIKASSYLHFWQLLMHQEKSASHYLLRNHYFFRLIDLLTGKESPFIKQHPFAQDIPKNLLTFVFDSIDLLLPFKLNLRGKKVLERSFFPTNSLEAHILTSSQFYRRLLRLEYDHDSLSHLITHFSQDDLDFSAVIADFLVFFLSDREQIRDIPLFFKHVADFLKIRDGLERVRMGWVVGIGQNKNVDAKEEYCLNYSERSDCIRYISGINYKRGFTSFDNRKPMLEVFSDKRLQDQLANVFIIKTLLEVALSSETAFEYLASLPPLTYHMRCIFDAWPDFISSAGKEGDLIFDRKLQVIEEMRSMQQMVNQKVDVIKNTLPVQKYIIGKTKQAEIVSKGSDNNLEFTLKKLCTYVLENKPLGDENESMPKKYFSSPNLGGIANAFIHYRSKHHHESQAKDIKTMNTLYVLSGKVNSRFTLIFKGKLFRHHIVLAEGEFSIVFPFEKEAEIDQLVDMLPAGEEKIEVAGEELERILGVKQVGGMEDQKMVENAGVPAVEGAGFTEPKIKCSFCTFDNQLTRDHCEMCDNPLFN